ncbi:MAG TPA: arginine--tRNA ligase [Firmicutes bacterium]|nr:arginine--tRNA ligase [Bacillota bacterium]
MDNIEESVKLEFQKALKKIGVDVGIEDIVIEHSKIKEHGDLATNIAMRMAKQLKKAPVAIANDIIECFDKETCNVLKLEVAGPGFINVFLKNDSLQSLIKNVIDLGDNYGRSNVGENKKINVEYVSANPTGELHLGHARGAAVGDSLTRILSFCGFDVTREYYINDAGNQVNNLAYSVASRYLQQNGIEAEVPENGYHGADIIGVAKKIKDQYGDKLIDVENHYDLFKSEGIRLNLDRIKNDLNEFGVNFDVFTSEQWLRDQGLVEKAMKDIIGSTYKQDNAVFLKTTEDGDDKDRVLVKSDGSYTYLVPDIAYHRYKYERGFETIIDILGADHHGYISRLKYAMKALGKDPSSIEIVMVQMVRLFKDGQEYKMSKRTGNAVSMKELVEEVGKDAVRFFFVTRSASSHLDFDLDLAKTMGATNPVYYCQYSHARLSTILESGNTYEIDDKGDLLNEESERNLLKIINEFPATVKDAGLTREPYKITIYIRKLANAINEFYTLCRVLDPSNVPLTKQRLGLVKACKITLNNALKLIGVSAPDHM